MNKVIEDGQRNIDQVRADAAAAADQRVRDAATKYAGRAAAAEAGRDSCTAAASQAAANHARVLAELLGEADRLAGVYAEAADQARVRGLACEAAFSVLEREGAVVGSRKFIARDRHANIFPPPFPFPLFSFFWVVVLALKWYRHLVADLHMHR
ncbi:DUF2514 family protein [Pseudomonas sp. QE6]|uniref:DUF2514 family protein n=1 Tax=Pseudomonas sp. QE6 TaxID=3242491 RepID=UPI0035292F39